MNKFYEDVLELHSSPCREMEEYSVIVPEHIPEEIKAASALELTIYDNSKNFPINDDRLISSKAMFALINDTHYMPKIWNQLKVRDGVEVYFYNIKNFLNIWINEDRITLSAKEKELKALTSNLSKCLKNIRDSKEIYYISDEIFKEALRKDSAHIQAYIPSFKYILEEIVDGLNEQEEFFLQKAKINSGFLPRKINASNSFQTYLIQRIGPLIKEIFKSPRYKIVAETVGVLTQSQDYVDQETVRKILSSTPEGF